MNQNHREAFLMKLYLAESAKELKSTRSIVMCAALIALYIALDSLSVFTLSTQKYTVAFISLALLGYGFGIVPSALAAFACDLVGYLIKPMGAYHPGFAISKILTCAIFALFLYRKEIKLWRIITSRAIINIFINGFLNAYWLAALYSSKGYSVILIDHLYKNLTLLPFEIVVLFFMLKAFKKISHSLNKNRS